MENDKKNKGGNIIKGSLNSVSSNNDYHHKKSLDVESDESENFIEIENDFNLNDLENELSNNLLNINLSTNNNKCNNSNLLNKSYFNVNSVNNNNKVKNIVTTKPSSGSLYNNITTNDSINNINESNQNINKFNINTYKETNFSPLEGNCNCKDILLVDDDEFILKTSKNILKKFKLEADCAENGQECLNKIKEKLEKNCNCSKNKYKIVLMDITMPVMDGIEAAKNIQKMINEKQLYDSIKIIFISAHVNLDLSSIMSEIKCALDYYAKPINVAKYKALLDKYYYSK
jgi:CheY-like chemotaxis protein